MESRNNSEFDKLKELQKSARNQTISLILAAFGFVAGLAWNEAIKTLIDTIFVIGTNTLLAKFTYAIFVTLIIVIVSIYLSKFKQEE